MINIAISKFDKVGIALVSRLPSGFRPFFRFISNIGHPVTVSCIGFGIVIYSILQQEPTVFFSGASIGVALLVSTILKRTIERSRPLTEYVTAMRISSFSFPSGHTFGSTVSFGLLAYYASYVLPQPFSHVLPFLLITLAILVGLSRVYLGAHYPTDVIGGWILGGIMLCVVIFGIQPLA